ncbi:DUF2964 family protein [Trinickia fusca]|uniref:DUF2964 family protein n=1 Tax=Trinickia fusca TaxID=2419777 RepID=A0A494WYB6_9BURK|nr:DUF2964 family protein [Trinickia fusca]RKP43538.1 DUF2964 family protein [Trinickia fusca]
MIRAELRVVLAVIATFVALAGIAVAIHGLLFDYADSVLYGVAAIVVGVFGCAVLLNCWPTDT